MHEMQQSIDDEEKNNQHTGTEMAKLQLKSNGKSVVEEHAEDESMVVKLKGNDTDSADESEPFLSRKHKEIDDPLVIVKNKVTKMEDVNRYSYNVNFVDDTLNLIKKKDIYPRLFKLKIISILTKVVTVLVLAALVTVFRLYLSEDELL